MQNRIHRNIQKSMLLCLLVGALVLPSLLPVLAEKTTADKLAETGDAIEELQKKSKEAKAQLDAAKKEQSAIGDRLDELNAQMEDVQRQLANIDARITKKNEQLAATKEELAAMEDQRAERYEEMKVRIRFMYEHSDSSMLESLLGAHSMSEFLNRVEYFSQIVDYDRQKLTEYQSLLSGLEKKQSLYEGQKEELIALQVQQQEQFDKLSALVSDTREDLKLASAATEDAKDALENVDEQLQEQLAYEAALEAQKAAEDKARMEEIRRQEEELRRKREEEARRRAEAERLRQEEEQRRQEEQNASGGGEEETSYEETTELPVSAEDVELLACIIQCEADGEPYEGKLAVGSVVLNRVDSSSFPNTIMGVIYQPGQFSPVASGRMAARVAAGANSTCRQAAQEVLDGNITVPYLYFRTNTGIIDGYVIGNHVFY